MLGAGHTACTRVVIPNPLEQKLEFFVLCFKGCVLMWFEGPRPAMSLANFGGNVQEYESWRLASAKARVD